MEQSGKDPEHGEKDNKQNEESKEDKIELVSDKFESKRDKKYADNKEEGDNFNLVSNSQDLDKETDWFQEAQPDNILDQGLLEISLASPVKVKLTFPEEKVPKWGDEEDIKKAPGKSETKQEEEEAWGCEGATYFSRKTFKCKKEINGNKQKYCKWNSKNHL
ncbi:uncharacterized protein LOC131857523 [Cryptomeria japonica]|uniref:uncharacterized protein LOC131857523 n=1 Tax=Cryptomeria japonica TaxID=3369 RepID=UPI0027DA49DB|nr:uncharacterized protein LOC131857523 [Cryptomeria japonica]